MMRRLGQAAARLPTGLRRIGETANKIDRSPLGAVVRANPYTNAAMNLAKKGNDAADFLDKVGSNVKDARQIFGDVRKSMETGSKNDVVENMRAPVAPAVPRRRLR